MDRRNALLAAALAAVAVIPAQAGQGSDRPAPVPLEAPICAPGVTPAAEAPPPSPPPVLVEGLGYAGIEPDSTLPEARAWFRQGIRLIWAFDEAEAIRSFKEAQRLDPACAMCAWGEAWARGPTINLQPRTDELSAASAAAARSFSLGGKLGPRDAALVAAMRIRTGGRRDFRNKGYAKEMAKLAARFGGDDAILVIAADAAMVASSRSAKPGSPAQLWLEQALRRNPDHSGAIHMYIHLTDWIGQQALAEPYADRLGRIAPTASHLVHMPSHTFYGVGRYADAASVNMKAVAADRAYAARVRPPDSDYRIALYAHDLHFAIESALMRGDGDTALSAAKDFRARYPIAKDKGGRPILRAATWYALGLHEDVPAVLAMPEPGSSAALMRAMRHYARGEALARTGDAAGVRSEAAAIGRLRGGPEGRALGSKGAEALTRIAELVLQGRAAMAERQYRAAATSFRAAMVVQGKADFGSDPPPYWYNVRRSLGAALLAAGEPESARNQLLASLRKWPRDALALYALAQAEQALGLRAEAAKNLALARKGWAGDIEKMPLARI